MSKQDPDSAGSLINWSPGSRPVIQIYGTPVVRICKKCLRIRNFAFYDDLATAQFSTSPCNGSHSFLPADFVPKRRCNISGVGARQPAAPTTRRIPTWHSDDELRRCRPERTGNQTRADIWYVFCGFFMYFFCIKKSCRRGARKSSFFSLFMEVSSLSSCLVGQESPPYRAGQYSNPWLSEASSLLVHTLSRFFAGMGVF